MTRSGSSSSTSHYSVVEVLDIGEDIVVVVVVLVIVVVVVGGAVVVVVVMVALVTAMAQRWLWQW